MRRYDSQPLELAGDAEVGGSELEPSPKAWVNPSLVASDLGGAALPSEGPTWGEHGANPGANRGEHGPPERRHADFKRNMLTMLCLDRDRRKIATYSSYTDVTHPHIVHSTSTYPQVIHTLTTGLSPGGFHKGPRTIA